MPPSLIIYGKGSMNIHDPKANNFFFFFPIILYHATYYSLYTQSKIERYFPFYLKRNECDMDISNIILCFRAFDF